MDLKSPLDLRLRPLHILLLATEKRKGESVVGVGTQESNRVDTLAGGLGLPSPRGTVPGEGPVELREDFLSTASPLLNSLLTRTSTSSPPESAGVVARENQGQVCLEGARGSIPTLDLLKLDAPWPLSGSTASAPI